MLVVGCAGGVGTTTVARLLGPTATDAGTHLPHADGRPLVLVARGTAAGTQAATRVLTASRPLEHYRPTLVVVADGPWPTPAQARARLRMLTDPTRIRVVVQLPYVPAWRDLDDPLTDTQVPAKVRRAVAELTAALDPIPAQAR